MVQGFLSRTDEHITELQEEVKKKDEEIDFLRSMLASLSEKVEQLEKTAIGRMGEGGREGGVSEGGWAGGCVREGRKEGWREE